MEKKKKKKMLFFLFLPSFLSLFLSFGTFFSLSLLGQ